MENNNEDCSHETLADPHEMLFTVLFVSACFSEFAISALSRRNVAPRRSLNLHQMYDVSFQPDD